MLVTSAMPSRPTGRSGASPARSAVDPLEHARGSTADLAGDAPDRPVGRLGIALVTSMAARIRYARDDGWNRLVVALVRAA